MAVMTYMEAARSAIREEMRIDPRIFLLGQDVELHVDSEKEFGPSRVRNTPISEAGFIGAALGAALTGMRPVVELGCSTFLYSAMDQVVNQAAKSRYMFGGQASVPLLIRAPVMYSFSAAAHHSDRPWALFAQAPGLKIIAPTSPHDVKGMLKSAIRDGNPVLSFEDATLWGDFGEVPDRDYVVPLGVADVKKIGSDISIVAVGGAVRASLIAAEKLNEEGISVEVVDIRSIVPLDREGILRSVTKTGHLVVVDPAPGTCSVASEISAMVAEFAFGALKSSISRLTAPNVPVPFSPTLERLMYPTAEKIAALVHDKLNDCSRSRIKRTA